MEGKFCEVRQFGKLGALPLPLARDNSVDHMINKVIVEPLSLTLDTLSPETQPLGYGATLLVFGLPVYPSGSYQGWCLLASVRARRAWRSSLHLLFTLVTLLWSSGAAPGVDVG